MRDSDSQSRRSVLKSMAGVPVIASGGLASSTAGAAKPEDSPGLDPERVSQLKKEFKEPKKAQQKFEELAPPVLEKLTAEGYLPTSDVSQFSLSEYNETCSGPSCGYTIDLIQKVDDDEITVFRNLVSYTEIQGIQIRMTVNPDRDVAIGRVNPDMSESEQFTVKKESDDTISTYDALGCTDFWCVMDPYYCEVNCSCNFWGHCINHYYLWEACVIDGDIEYTRCKSSVLPIDCEYDCSGSTLCDC